MHEIRARRGKVVDAAGAPVAGARVAITWGTAPTPEIGIITNVDGGFRVGLPDGRFRFEAYTLGGRIGIVETDGFGEEEIVIVVERVNASSPWRGDQP